MPSEDLAPRDAITGLTPGPSSSGEVRGAPHGADGLGHILFDRKSVECKARGAETAILLNPEGEVHAGSFHFIETLTIVTS